MEIDLEKDIETLLKGEKLESKSKIEHREENSSAFVELDIEKVREEMSRWETKIEELSKNEIIKDAKDKFKRDVVTVIK
jgi:hypothetical protein